MIHSFHSPGGKTIRLDCRDGFVDQQVAVNVISRDEYGLGRYLGMDMEVVLDVGSYIGAFACMAAVELQPRLVVAVEPIEENAHRIATNANLNFVSGTILIESRAAGVNGTMTIGYRYDNAYAYVGNMYGPHPGKGSVIDVPSVSLGRLLEDLRIQNVGLMKIDCEGCEWNFLQDGVEQVGVIVGEYHGDPDNLYELLGYTHRLSIKDFIFTAVRR